MPHNITDSHIASLLAALQALEPTRADGDADRVFEATRRIVEAKLGQGCSPKQIIESFRTEGIPLGQRRVTKFVRSLAPKKPKHSRTRRATARPRAAVKPMPGSPAVVNPTPEPPAPPKATPPVEPTKPPQGGPLVGATPSSPPGSVQATKRRSNASLGDNY